MTIENSSNAAGTRAAAPSKQRVRFRLRSKLLAAVLILESVLLTAVILVVEQQMRASISNKFVQYGLSITRTLASINSDLVMTYDYVKIDQHLGRMVDDHQLLYAAVILFDGEVASYKERSDGFRELVLKGELLQRALNADRERLYQGEFNGIDFYDVVIPLTGAGQRWGAVRVGFSLDDLHTAIGETRQTLLLLGVIALLCGWVASVSLARRMTRPIQQLVDSVRAITNGEYQKPINIKTSDEIGYLGKQFSVMQTTLQRQFQELVDTNVQLTDSNRRLQSEITKRQQSEEQIRHLAFYDQVTGLPNRSLLREHLRYWLERAERDGFCVAVFFLDLDHFKRVNDTLGHTAGDTLLCEAANRLSNCLRETDYIARRQDVDEEHSDFTPSSYDGNTVARLGGDEFVMVLTSLGKAADAVHVAQRVNQVLSQPFDIRGHQMFISCSIGISCYPNNGRDPEKLLRRADTAMYCAKAQGRNNHQLYATTMDADAEERMTLESKLRESIEKEHFLVYYQPKADIQSGEITGAEALIRWRHPEDGFIPPSKFIPIAEDTGLINELGAWVMKTVCAQMVAWEQAGLAPLRISVNLSAVQFKHGNLTQQVVQILDQTGLAAHRLELELTESLLMENLDTAIGVLNELKTIGVNLSIDDFGTGYSSLNYLKRLPIDTLKIDRSFINNVDTDQDDAAIVAATVTLAHNLRLQVIAEGVERYEQLALLAEQRCDEIQGYFLSPPLAADAFVNFVCQQSQQTSNGETEPARLSVV